jgi:hypothetical protein
MALPPLSAVRWPSARRIISTRRPTIFLFEDIADPGDWDLIAAAETKTNPRFLELIGNLALVPPARRIGGDGASNVMAPFVHVSTDRPGRFHDGTFGACYAGKSAETAIHEHAYHREVFFCATNETPGWFSQYRELIGVIDAELHDLRGGDPEFDEFLDPDDYRAPQQLARELRALDANGVVYPSVRHPGGECVAALWPNVVGIPVQGRALAYHFDGTRVDLIRDETTGAVFARA